MKSKQHLEKIYSNFIDYTDPFDFFKGLAEYMEYIYDTPELKKTFDDQIEERNKHYRKVQKLEKKIEQEVSNSMEKILDVIKRKKVDTSKFESYLLYSRGDNIFKEFEDFLGGRLSTAEYPSDLAQRYLYDFAINLKNLGFIKEIREFVASDKEYSDYYRRVNNDGNIIRNEYGNFIFSKTWPERFEVINLLQSERIFKSWGSFEKLYFFEKAYNASVNNINYWSDINHSGIKIGFDERLEARNIIEVWEITEDFKVLKETHSNSLYKQYPPNKLRKLDPERFRADIKRVHGILTRNSLDGPSKNKEDYSNMVEVINLRSLGIKIEGNLIFKRGISPKKVFNPTERKLIYFLYMKSKNQKDECFNLKQLAKELQSPEGTIRNSITTVNTTINENILKSKVTRMQFIKNQPRRGYHLNPQFLI